MLTSVSAVVIVLLLMDLAVVRPLFNYYSTLEEEIVSSEKQLAQNMMNITRKDIIEKQYELFASLIRVPGTDEEETASMLSELETLSTRSKVTLIDIKSQEIKNFEFYKEFAVSLDLEAEMEPLIRFLHQVEASSNLMKVVSSKLTPKGKESPLIKAKIDVTKVVMLQ